MYGDRPDRPMPATMVATEETPRHILPTQYSEIFALLGDADSMIRELTNILVGPQAEVPHNRDQIGQGRTEVPSEYLLHGTLKQNALVISRLNELCMATRSLLNRI